SDSARHPHVHQYAPVTARFQRQNLLRRRRPEGGSWLTRHFASDSARHPHVHQYAPVTARFQRQNLLQRQ
ncbi:hypothetical protein, partial [Pantoea stewartii]|uniref:hypothetical protein n=1 Tax=Pantoea stewartii TaxID=66269 RepID=UPI00198200F3